MIYSERNNGKKKTDFNVIKSLVGNSIGSIFVTTSGHFLEYIYGLDEVSDFFIHKTNRLKFNVFLFDECVNSDEDLFDIIEVTILFLAKKLQESTIYGRTHDDWKYSDFGKFCKRMDEIMPGYGYKLNQAGEIEKIPDDGMVELIDQNVKTDEPERFENKIKEAEKAFFSKTANIESRKNACATLASVAEYFRNEISGTEVGTEVDDLMKVVNTCDIRHNKKSTRILLADNKDDESFVEWVFYGLRNCINFYIKSFYRK